ncbi:hypothetical protein [Gelidibacter sp.]
MGRNPCVVENQHKLLECDIMICPPELNKFGTFDGKNIDEIVVIGYNAANAALDKP